jgi:hypothetical protein
MDLIEEKLGGPLRALWDIALFDYALLFMTTLLASVLLLMLIDATLYLAPALTGVALAAYYLRGRRHYDPVRSIEKGNPALRERLSAAYDNRSKENLVVRELVKEVAYDLENVNTGAFLDRGRTNAYVVASIIIVFILLSLLFAGFEGLNLGGLMGGSGGSGGSSQGKGSGGGGGGGGQAGESESSQEETVGQGSSQNIYGDSSIARIEGQELELEIHPEYGETEGFDMGGDGEGISGMEGYVQATAAETYGENLPVELEGSIRRYFEKLTED